MYNRISVRDALLFWINLAQLQRTQVFIDREVILYE